MRATIHLPLHFNGLNLYVTELYTSIHQTASACKQKAKPYQCISNHRAKIITLFIWPRGVSVDIFEVKHFAHLKVGG